MKLTVSLSCYQRPDRTKRAIDCIINQDINGWEAFIMGDACPYFQNLIDTGYLENIKKNQIKYGNVIHYFNEKLHGGSWGYKLTNHAIQNANGKYIIFYDNDDIILPNHFRHYLSEIENTKYDLVYYQSELVPLNEVRKTQLQISCIGHCDIIIKSELAKKLKPHNTSYAQDWEFINEAYELGKHKKANSTIATYKVMRLGSAPLIENID